MNDDDAEALLAAVLCGEVAADDPRVIALLREEPWREAELAAARSAQSAVQAAVERRRSTLAAARQMTDAPGEERLAASMAQHVADLQRSDTTRRPGAGPDRGPWPLRTLSVFLALAAGVALALLFRPWQTHPDTGTPPTYLGSNDVTPLAPIGEVHASSWPAFRWQGHADGFQVIVYRAGSTRQPHDEICRSPVGIVGNEWQPDAQARTRLAMQTQLEWELRYDDPNGGGAFFASATLVR